MPPDSKLTIAGPNGPVPVPVIRVELPGPQGFERNRFYNLDAIGAMVAPMTARAFLESLGLNRAGKDRIFQAGAMGSEILDAIERAGKRLGAPERENPCLDAPTAPKAKGKRGRKPQFDPI